MTDNNPEQKKEPVARAEDVDYSRKMADEEDREAAERAAKADERAK
ncbi:MAG TPA: YfhD family protein [Bacillales bacterium]|nr:YfhD family protein [Bacillales bacterium]